MEKYLRGWNAQTLYALEYEHGGSKWALNFYAVDYEDAVAKVESLKKSLVLLGESGGFIPWDDNAKNTGFPELGGPIIPNPGM